MQILLYAQLMGVLKLGNISPSTPFVPRTTAARRCETAGSGQALDGTKIHAEATHIRSTVNYLCAKILTSSDPYTRT